MENVKIDVFQKILIIGVGGTGSWTALFSSFIGVKSIKVFDAGMIKDRDIDGKCCFSKKHLGLNKAKALAQLIKEINPATNIEVYDRNFEIQKDVDHLINGTFISADDDKLVSQISEICTQKGFRHSIAPYSGYNSATFSKYNSNIKINRGYVDSWVGSCSTSAILACTSMFTTNFEYALNMKSIIDGKTVTDSSFMFGDGNGL